MPKIFLEILLYVIVLFICISCSCPVLKPNTNVIVTCSIENGSKNCLNNSTAKVPTGTIAIYKCPNYFKSFNRAHTDGMLNCTADGTWTNQNAFQNFYCEVDCGKQPAIKNELIRGGNSTKSKYWPWIATIFRQTKDGHFKYSCGGTLIGQKTILTAAHCLTDASMNKLPVDMFKISLATFSSNFQENTRDDVQILSLKEIHIHPDYRVDSLSSDIAIIVLSESATLTESVLPICLPNSYDQDSVTVEAGNIGEIASFGIDGTGAPAKILQHAHIPILTSSNCNDVINVIPHGDQFCAGEPDGANICRGDSGSGLAFKSAEWNEEKYSIHGLVSNTGEVANGCAPMVIFTKVFSHISWIQEHLIAAENITYPKTITLKNAESRIKLQATSQLPKLYTKPEEKALAKLRPMVQNILLEDYMHKDEYLIRFLRTKDLNLKEAKQMLQNTMEWRKANRIDEILKEDFTQFRKDYPVFHEGFDKDGRPIFVYIFGLWDLRKITHSSNAEVAKFDRYMLRNFEEAEERIRSIGQRNISNDVTITDLHGINFRQHLCASCLRIWRNANLVYETHYPQKVYRAYFINTPPIADSIMEAIRPFNSEHSTDILRVFGTNKTEWSQALLKQIPADQLFIAYGGTRVIKEGTKRIQLAL